MKHIPTYKEFLNEGVPTEDMHIYEVICRDQEGELKKIIECIGACGNTGHGFSVIVDPDEPEGLAERKFYWDGDGSDYLHSVKTIQTPVKESVNEANSQDFTKKLPGKFYQYGSEGKKYPGKYEIEVFVYDQKKVADDLHKVLTDSKFLDKHPLFNIRVETMDGYRAVDESQEINEANRDIVNRQLNLLEVYAKDVLRNPKGNIEHFAQYIIDGIKEIRQNL
jgi:hypothetical protein